MAPLTLQPAPKQAGVARRRGPPTALRIDTPAHNPAIAVALADHSTASLSSATSDISADFPFAAPPAAKPRSLRNMKKLSLTLSPATSSTHSLQIPHPEPPSTAASSTFGTIHSAAATSAEAGSIPPRSRRPSVASLATTTSTAAALAVRRDEDGESPTVPYADGPIEIIPGIWLGSEDNARDVDGLAQRGIKAVLNVAKEVTVPIETEGLNYLKMDWSHGQSDLIKGGFPAAMAFVDAARERNEGVLVQ
jgi:tyrosine-protein phosphatase MSG5